MTKIHTVFGWSEISSSVVIPVTWDGNTSTETEVVDKTLTEEEFLANVKTLRFKIPTRNVLHNLL